MLWVKNFYLIECPQIVLPFATHFQLVRGYVDSYLKLM